MSSQFLVGATNPVTIFPAQPKFANFQPRAIVQIDGNYYFLKSYSIKRTAHGALDQATVVLPIQGDATKGISYPDWTTSIARSEELGNANVPVFIKIYSGFPNNPALTPTPAGLSLRFSGVVDDFHSILEANETTFSCRSLAAPLTSTQITSPFAGQAAMTTQTFIQKACAYYGLTAVFNAPSYGTMQDVLGSEYVTGVHSWYIWNLILQCAQFDNVDVWVDRSGVLHYEAATLIQRTQFDYFWFGNIKGFTGSHSVQFSKNVEVQVHSWTKRTKTHSAAKVSTGPDGQSIVTASYTRTVTSTPVFGTTETVQTSVNADGSVTVGTSVATGGGANAATGFTSAGGDTGKQKYVEFVKNKDQAGCIAMAQALWEQISQHEYATTFLAPVTPDTIDVDVTSELVVYHVPLVAFNAGYWPREIAEDFSSKAFRFTFDAVNHPLAQGAP